MISILQNETSRSQNEPIITKHLADIIGHNKYFASAHHVNSTSILSISKKGFQKEDSESTNVVKTTGPFQHLNSLTQFFDSLIPHHFVISLVGNHIHSAQAINKLIDKNIIHYGIDSYSIQYDTKQGIPILSRFNKSFLTTEIMKETPDVFQQKYECLDTWILQSLTDSPNWANKRIDILSIQNIIDIFFPIKNNHYFKWKKYIDSFSNSKNKSLAKDLVQHWNTWDLHALHTFFMKIIQSNTQLFPILTPYHQYLEHQTQCLPTERQSPYDFIYSIYKIYDSIDLNQYSLALSKT